VHPEEVLPAPLAEALPRRADMPRPVHPEEVLPAPLAEALPRRADMPRPVLPGEVRLQGAAR